MKKLRVLFFSTHFAEYSIRMALSVAAECRVVIFVNQDNLHEECEPDFVLKTQERITLLPIACLHRNGRVISTFRVVAAALWFRPNIVHVQEVPTTFTAFLVKALAFFTKVVLTVHDPQPHSGADWEIAERHKESIVALRGCSSAYHVHGAYCRDTLKQSLCEQKPILTTNLGTLMTSENSVLPLDSSLLLFGRMQAYKGIADLLDALDILGREGIYPRLTLAGTGPELVRLRERIAKMSNVSVIERFLSPTEAREEIRRSAVMMAPYRDATQSGIVASAFANGRPVIASNVGGLADVVRDEVNGLLVPAGCPQSLASAIRRFITDKCLRSRVSEGAIESARNELSWEKIGPEIIGFYSQILKRR